MRRLQAITDGIVVLAMVYAFGNLGLGMILAYQWFTCNMHM